MRELSASNWMQRVLRSEFQQTGSFQGVLTLLTQRHPKLTTAPPVPAADTCDICVPPPDLTTIQGPAVTIYPMKKVAKAPKEQSTAVCLVEWRGAEDDLSTTKWLFVKRPEKGRSLKRCCILRPRLMHRSQVFWQACLSPHQ